MTATQLLLHLLNFVLPAWALALCMPLAGRWVMGARRPAVWPWPRRVMCHGLAGMVVLALGLWLQGQDGRMATYLALVLVLASLEWALLRGWQR